MGWRKERGLRFLLRPKSIDRADPIAYAELNPMPQSPEDYWIGHFIVNPIHRGRSIGTEFARSLLDKAFDEFAARSVILVVFPENASAIRCYEKAGMQIMGRERKYFETTRRSCEFLRMGIGRDAWRSQARQMPAHL